MNPRYRLISEIEELLEQPEVFNQLRALWEQQGWQKAEVEGRVRTDKDWNLTLHRALHFVSVWDGAKLIGFGRCTYDIVATRIYDIVTDQAYRRQKIGRRIMIDLIEAALLYDEDTQIWLDPWEGYLGNKQFYESLGFVEEQPGMRLERIG
jgi:GNAT superfamily N-acetyltransferase